MGDRGVRNFHEVTAINRERQVVAYRNLQTGESGELPYDRLILSPGASPVRPPIEGLEHAYTLRNIADMDRIKAAVQASGPAAVVIGAGFIGLEVAENLAEAGKQVTVVEAADQVLPPLDPEMAALVEAELRRHGVKLHTSAIAARVSEQAVTLKDGRELPADLVILAVGVRPEDALARGAGLDTHERGGILISETMQTSDPHIYAVGDATLSRDPLGRSAFVPLAWGANRQGRLVADHIAGRRIQFGGHPATAIAKVFDLAAASTGLSEKQLRAEGLPYAVIHTHGSSHAGYYPGAKRLSLKLVFDPETGRIYGAQAVGAESADKRIDVIATAIHAGLTAEALADLPLAYAPPFGSAKDPVNMLGYIAENMQQGDVETVQWHEVGTEPTMPVIDVRNPDEFARGALPGAVNIPLPELRERLDEVRGLGAAPVVYCQVGQRGYNAARLLSGHGISARNLDGGYTTWASMHA